jgi:hypothetical protein
MGIVEELKRRWSEARNYYLEHSRATTGIDHCSAPTTSMGKRQRIITSNSHDYPAGGNSVLSKTFLSTRRKGLCKVLKEKNNE